MRDIGRPVRATRNEFRRRHAEKGHGEERLGGKGVRNEPEEGADAPGSAGSRRNKGVALGPYAQIVAWRTLFIGTGEHAGRNGRRDLEKERDDGEPDWDAARIEQPDHAQRRKWQEQVTASEAIKQFDAAGEHRVGVGVPRVGHFFFDAHFGRPAYTKH